MSPRSATVAAIRSLVPVVAQERGISETDLLFGRALKHFLARRELFWRCRQLDGLPGSSLIGEVLGFDASTVRNALRWSPGSALPDTEKCQRCRKPIRPDGFCSARCSLIPGG